MNRRPLTIAAATVGVLATAAFALPNLPPNPVTEMVGHRIHHEKDRRFASAADLPAAGDPAFALPRWVPKDATDIRMKARTRGEARLIRFTLGATPLAGHPCAAAPAKPERGPGLTARWWPGDTRAEERAECGDPYQYQVVVRGKQVYAWTDGTPSPGGR
jgi:hypothetical protein